MPHETHAESGFLLGIVARSATKKRAARSAAKKSPRGIRSAGLSLFLFLCGFVVVFDYVFVVVGNPFS